LRCKEAWGLPWILSSFAIQALAPLTPTRCWRAVWSRCRRARG
jgi:hypothetical protein